MIGISPINVQIELEQSARLRQPEVSIVMRQLKERDCMNEREEKKPGKGRPFKIYALKVGSNEIIAQLEKQQRKAVEGIGEIIKPFVSTAILNINNILLDNSHCISQ